MCDTSADIAEVLRQVFGDTDSDEEESLPAFGSPKVPNILFCYTFNHRDVIKRETRGRGCESFLCAGSRVANISPVYQSKR